MPDKLTDNEIIKALECCGNTSLGHCENCPLNDDMGFVCIIDKSQAALDLINRLQAENERLNALIAETNKQRGAVIHAITHIDQVKAEAYKEFAERLKKQMYQSSDRSHGEHPFVVEESDIDNTLYEMVGE